MEYGLMHQSAASACISGNNNEGYAMYARLVIRMLRDGVSLSTRRVPGAPIDLRALFLDALHAIVAGVSHEICDVNAVPDSLVALRAVVEAARVSKTSFEAAILANYGLARHSWDSGDRVAAAAYNEAALKAGSDAAAAGERLGGHGLDKLAGARDNLLQLRLPEGSLAKVVHGAMMHATNPGGVATRTALLGGQPPIAPSLCASCGRDLATMKCGRCGKVRYCNADCQRAHWRTHKPGCNTAAAAASTSGAGADGSKAKAV